ncbi:hypothetical protein GOP47_0026163 [Adiantum capillus-veneris]|uniref:Uncharacterized protein n=1 Tax=Adiantum capillus-veneris TaxID=13818 RepID=A0A9D4Z3I5_ADICA|nr:hypothetical protein GOP47_0026163 [Adiantum capillus-veneris]
MPFTHFEPIDLTDCSQKVACNHTLTLRLCCHWLPAIRLLKLLDRATCGEGLIIPQMAVKGNAALISLALHVSMRSRHCRFLDIDDMGLVLALLLHSALVRRYAIYAD